MFVLCVIVLAQHINAQCACIHVYICPWYIYPICQYIMWYDSHVDRYRSDDIFVIKTTTTSTPNGQAIKHISLESPTVYFLLTFSNIKLKKVQPIPWVGEKTSERKRAKVHMHWWTLLSTSSHHRQHVDVPFDQKHFFPWYGFSTVYQQFAIFWNVFRSLWCKKFFHIALKLHLFMSAYYELVHLRCTMCTCITR